MRISKDRIDMDDKVLQKPVLKDYGFTVVGGASGTNIGSAGYHLDFDGTNDYVTIAAHTSLNTDDFSISMWLKPDQLRIQGIIFKNAASSWRVFMNNTSGNIEFDSLTDTYNLSSSTAIAAGVWSHVVVTYSKSSTRARIYINDASAGEDTSFSNAANDQNLAVVISQNSTNRFDGGIDDVRFFNREITSSEVSTLYVDGTVSSGLVAHLDMDDGSGNASDSSGNGRTGTLTGTPDWTASSANPGYTINLQEGNYFNLVLIGNSALTFANPPASGTYGFFTLVLKQDSVGSRTVVWPSAVKWPNDTAPTLTTSLDGVDILTFTTVDGGSTWLGSHSGSFPGFSYQDLGEAHAESATTTYNFSSYSIGSTDSRERVVYILYAGEETGARTLSSKSIAGTAATDVIALASFNNVHYGIMKRTIPAGSGTTGTISFTWSGNVTRMQIYGYVVYGATQEDTGTTTGTNPSFSMDVWQGGVSACMLACQNNQTVTWGGSLVEQYNSSWTANSEFSIGAEEGVASTQADKTHSATASDSGSALFGVSLR